MSARDRILRALARVLWRIGSWVLRKLARWSYAKVCAYVELRAGYELLGQAKRDDQARYTSSFSYFGGAGVRFPIASRLGAQIGGGAGGRLFELRGQGWQHRLDLQAVASLLWQWSVR